MNLNQKLSTALAGVASAALAIVFSTSQALAGDQAKLKVLGFSDDGGIFAFEEYGVQDGSGFPYANRIYIDTSDDSFVSGSPIRVRIEDETATVDAARSDAASQGSAIIADADLNEGFLAGSNQVTELNADPFRMVVNPRPVVPPIDMPLEVRLAEKQFAAVAPCDGVSDATIGFTLTQIEAEPGGTTRLLHDDSSVPGSRNCPLGYSLGGISTFYPDSSGAVFAVLIAVRSFGFEGPDYRWMAVTASIDEMK